LVSPLVAFLFAASGMAIALIGIARR